MIRHIVFFTVKAGHDPEAVYNGLSILKDNPHAQHWELGRNMGVDTLTDDCPDFVVYAEFEDDAALKAYKAHPLYAESIRRVRPIRELRMAADFTASQQAIAPRT